MIAAAAPARCFPAPALLSGGSFTLNAVSLCDSQAVRVARTVARRAVVLAVFGCCTAPAVVSAATTPSNTGPLSPTTVTAAAKLSDVRVISAAERAEGQPPANTSQLLGFVQGAAAPATVIYSQATAAQSSNGAAPVGGVEAGLGGGVTRGQSRWSLVAAVGVLALAFGLSGVAVDVERRRAARG